MSRVIRRVGFLIGITITVFSTTKGLAGSAAMTSAQLALYQGADREKVLIEGAKARGSIHFVHIAYLVSHSRQRLRKEISVYQSFSVAQRLQERHPKSVRGSKGRPN